MTARQRLALFVVLAVLVGLGVGAGLAALGAPPLLATWIALAFVGGAILQARR